MDISQCGHMSIQLSQSYFSPGAQVDGLLNLNLQTPLSVRTSLSLWLAGIEAVSLLEQTSTYTYSTTADNARRKHKHTTSTRHNETRTLCNQQTHLFTFEDKQGTTPAGQYTMPFSFVWDGELPSSFELLFEHPKDSKREADRCFAVVKYVLVGVLRDEANQVEVLRQAVDLKVDHKRSEDVDGSGLTCKLSIHNQCCWCVGAGITQVVSSFERNEFCGGEVINVLAEVDNRDSNTSVDMLDVVLAQRCTLRAQSYTHLVDIEHRASEKLTVPAKALLEKQLVELPLTDLNSQNVTPTSRGMLVMNEYFVKTRVRKQAKWGSGDPGLIEGITNLQVRVQNQGKRALVPSNNSEVVILPPVNLQSSDWRKYDALPEEVVVKPIIQEGPIIEVGPPEDCQ